MKKAAVIHRTKHDKKTRRKAVKLAEHPAMKGVPLGLDIDRIKKERLGIGSGE